MLKKLGLLMMAGVFVLSVSACGKQPKEEKPATAPGSTPEGQLALPQKGQEATVQIPAEIKGKWKAIKIQVEDKTAKSKKEYVVKLGDTMPIPGTKLSINAVEFAPSFVMQGMSITSASNEPNNPAAKVIITEDGKEVFKGWLFQKFPTTHAFTHPTISIVLLEGQPA